MVGTQALKQILPHFLTGVFLQGFPSMTNVSSGSPPKHLVLVKVKTSVVVVVWLGNIALGVMFATLLFCEAFSTWSVKIIFNKILKPDLPASRSSSAFASCSFNSRICAGVNVWSSRTILPAIHLLLFTWTRRDADDAVCSLRERRWECVRPDIENECTGLKDLQTVAVLVTLTVTQRDKGTRA
jgi:hypothetical protein